MAQLAPCWASFGFAAKRACWQTMRQGAIALPYAETPITAKAWEFLQGDDIFLSYVVNGTMQFVESEYRMEAACQEAAQGLEPDGSRPMTPEELSDRSKRRPMDAEVVYGDLV